MKIAVASSDGKTIDTHFGKADKFYIYGVEKDHLKYLETRTAPSYADGSKRHSFRREAFANTFDTIKDCSQLYTVKIGDVPKSRLETLGLKVKVCEGRIEEAIN